MADEPVNPNQPEPRRVAGQGNSREISAVDVRTETELAKGWQYSVRINTPDGVGSDHLVTLAWCDHDYWSGGRMAPSNVIKLVLEYAVSQFKPGGAALPARFDAARLRRIFPDLDQDIRVGSML
jgi:hypothetical protein